jgi:hypothetical protein
MPVEIANFINGLRQYRDRTIALAILGVDQFGEWLIGRSQRLTPVKTGAMQASATTEPARLEGTFIVKRIGYNTSYSAAVHENLSAHHDIGQAKFLEVPMREDGPRFSGFVGNVIKNGLGGGAEGNSE